MEGFDLSAVSGRCVRCGEIGKYTRSTTSAVTMTVTRAQPDFVEGRLEVLYNHRKGVSF